MSIVDKSLLGVALSIKDLRKTEMILPITRKNVVVTPFLLGDHNILKTAVLSPQNYDREMLKCLRKHTKFIIDGKDIELGYEDLISQISNIDKICLIWACYKSTYENIGIREIPCEECKQVFKYKITLDELLHEDSLCVWEDESVGFYDYKFPISVPYEGYTYHFETSLPTVKRYNQVLGMISIDKIKKNLETNTVLSGSEELSVLVKTIRIEKNGEEIANSSNLQEIISVLDIAIPSQISEKLQSEYRERFDKYQPKFYTHLTCGSCSHEFKYNVDIETEFFRRTLFGREFGGKEL